MNIIQPSKCIAAKMSSYQITKRAITVTIKNISKIDSADMIILTILLQSHLVAHIIRINCKPRIPAPLMKDSVFKKMKNDKINNACMSGWLHDYLKC